jgi:DNA-binding response OmpR family regulator
VAVSEHHQASATSGGPALTGAAWALYPLLALAGLLVSASRQSISLPPLRPRAELIIDRESREARIGTAPVDLTFREFELLDFLMANPGKVFSREQLLGHVWGPGPGRNARTVDVHVSRLRRKLGASHGAHLVTMRRAGYKFTPSAPRSVSTTGLAGQKRSHRER